MNRRILGGLTAALLAGGLALTGGAVTSASDDGQVCGPLDSGKIDTTNDPETVTAIAPEGKLIDGYCVKAGSANNLDGPVYEDVIPAKQVTFGHPSGKDVSHYSVSYTDAPSPTPDWTPPQYPPFNPAECTEYRLEKSTSTWNATTGEWSAWVDWPDAGPLAWGVVPTVMTGNHGGTPEQDGHRVFAYVVVDERPITTGECAPPPDPAKLRLTFIQECGVFTPLAGPWSPPETVQFRLRNENAAPVDYVLRQAGGGVIESGELPVGDRFVTFPFGARTLILETYNEAGDKVAQDTKAGGDTYLTTDDDSVKCLPETPEPKLEQGEWNDGEFGCDDTTVTQSRTVSTTTYTWDGSKFVGETRTTTETRTRDLTSDEIFPCPTEPPVTTVPPTVPPTTEPPTTEPPTTEPPTVEPPVTTTVAPVVPTTEAVAALPPAQAPTTSTPAAPPTTPAAGLPATGSNGAGVTALIAMLVTSLGGAALLASRRRNVTG